jgi:glutathione peroxidase
MAIGLALTLAAPVFAQNNKATADAKCPAVLQHTVERLQDEKPQNLCQYAGQVVVVVNTASFCGFTPQYKGLEELHARYKDKGLVVLGFPSNDFSQEPGNNQKIADFCENTYGVKFPMFSKTAVRGADASPLFKQLTLLTDTAPKWNFYKYLISRDGKQVKSFNSTTDPMSGKFLAEIDKQLSAKLP